MFIFVGCTVAEPEIEVVQEQVAVDTAESITTTIPTATIVTETIMPSATPTIFQGPTEMATETPLPSATPTNTPTIAPTLTPFPTVAPEKRGELYDELMATNRGCELPCWWGLELGVSSLDDVVQLYQQFDPFITIQDFESGVTRITIKFVEPTIENGEQTTHTFRGRDNVLLESEIQVKKYENFTPLSLMTRFGQPSEVWLWTIPEPFEGVLPADFLMYFPEHGILAGYRELASNSEENVEVCLNGTGSSSLLVWEPSIWDPNGELSFIDRAKASSELSLITGQQRIEEVSNWDEATLYANVLDSASTDCLLTPSNLWTSP